MSPSVICYPQPGKAKSRRLLEAFAAGAGGGKGAACGVVSTSGHLQPGAAAFYGSVGIEPLFNAARARGDWYYLDNSFFDCARNQQYRVAHDRLQQVGEPDWQRFEALGLRVAPWRRHGRHIVVCAQSDYFMRQVVGWPGGAESWTKHVLSILGLHTKRPIVLREWSPAKVANGEGLQRDLKDAWALVTHSSAAANEALLAGVAVFCTGPCVAMRMGLSELERVEQPRRPDGREAWAASLAGAQWTEEELRSGAAWRRLHA